MAITIAEAQQRYAEALRIKLESNILEQWYYCLGETLVEQAEKRLDEPDFNGHWFISPSELLHYLGENGVEWTEENCHEAVIDFAKELIGDQLEEYGLEIRLIGVTDGFESANRFYFLKPGHEPSSY